jgi:hypothetical protein
VKDASRLWVTGVNALRISVDDTVPPPARVPRKTMFAPVVNQSGGRSMETTLKAAPSMQSSMTVLAAPDMASAVDPLLLQVVVDGLVSERDSVLASQNPCLV